MNTLADGTFVEVPRVEAPRRRGARALKWIVLLAVPALLAAIAVPLYNNI